MDSVQPELESPPSGALGEPIAPELLGSARLEPGGAFEAGSFQTFRLTYTAGRYGIDDSGSLRLCFRFASDQSRPQTHDPAAPGYTTVTASNGAVLDVRYDPKGNIRPWDRTLAIKVVRGFLAEGDTIEIVLGDTSGGSPGFRLQTFCEPTYEFRLLVDAIATYNFQPVAECPAIAIVPGPPETWRAVLPTQHRLGEPFRLSLKAEDRWGNPSDKVQARLSLEASVSVEGLPETVDFPEGERALHLEGLSVAGPGDLFVTLRDEQGTVLARSNPCRFLATEGPVHYWGDLHGQSEETIGTNSAHDYFSFARDLAFVDATGHQGNDFQITESFWQELGRLSAAFDEPGRFVVLPGYEWSGNTALGGDRNVFFRGEGRPIRRSSHALIPDRSDLETDCTTAGDLFRALVEAGEDCICFAHCGGRYADITQAHDGRIERSIEIHSSWGTFEWLLEDSFRQGYRVGIVSNSDGHKGRPGASYPGASMFGAIGGLTCYLMEGLDRDRLFDCLRKRRHYGTTGNRLWLDVRAALHGPATLYHEDPALGPAEGRAASEALMGDIVHLPEGGVTLSAEILAGAPVERVDLYNGLEHLETLRPFGEADLGNRIRVIWEGAEYRGRFRQVIWDGRADLQGNRIADASPINFLNRDKTLVSDGETELSWQALTTGNFGGFDLWLEDPVAGRIRIETPLVKAELEISEIGLEDRVFEAGGLARGLRVFRLPETNRHESFRLERPVALRPEGDNPLYLRVTTEDGHRAWSSPIYLFRK